MLSTLISFFNHVSYDKKTVSEYKMTSYCVVNPVGTQVDRVLFNFSFPGGICSSDSEGDDISATATMVVQAVEIDDNDEPTGYAKTEEKSYTMNTRTAQRITLPLRLKPGRYKVRAYRSDLKYSARDNKECNLESIVGLEYKPDTDYTDLNSISTASFLIKTSERISSSSGVKLNIDCSRKNDLTKTYNTLRDFVVDVWTNNEYGMGESLEYLEFREQLEEEISLVLDKSEQAFDHIKSVLKSFGYIIYPYLNKFIIKKESAQSFRNMLFSSKNTTKITFNYKLPDNNELTQGVKVRYIPEGEINFESVYFPEGLEDYDETVLPGVKDKAFAKIMAQYIFDKKRKILKTCEIETDLQGLLPELHSRVGVSQEYVDETFAAKGVSINLTEGSLKIDRTIDIDLSSTKYMYIEDIENNVFGPVEIINDVEENTDILMFNPTGIYFDASNEFQVVVGDRVEVIEDYIISSIDASEFVQDSNNYTKVRISLQEYVPDLYTDIE